MVGSVHEIPRRGDMIPVLEGNGVAPLRVETIDLAGYPTVGGERHDDAKTYELNRQVLVQRLGRLSGDSLTLEEQLAMIDMGDIGRDLGR